MSNSEGPIEALSKYHLKLEDGNLVPNSRYYLRENRLTEYETTGKYINFSYYSYFWNDYVFICALKVKNQLMIRIFYPMLIW